MWQFANGCLVDVCSGWAGPILIKCHRIDQPCLVCSVDGVLQYVCLE